MYINTVQERNMLNAMSDTTQLDDSKQNWRPAMETPKVLFSERYMQCATRHVAKLKGTKIKTNLGRAVKCNYGAYIYRWVSILSSAMYYNAGFWWAGFE